MSDADNEGRRVDLLIRNGFVATMDAARTVHAHGAVAIRGSSIVAVGPDAEVAASYEAANTLDAGGGLVHPGFVDAHYHSTIHASRDAIPDHGAAAVGRARAGFSVFSDWFNALEPEDEYASAQLACVEMARAGVTCFMDPGTTLEPDAVASAATRVGVRASVADPFLWDVEGGLTLASEIHRAPASTSRALDLLGGQLWRNSDPTALVRGHVAVYGSGSVSDELERAASECASAAGVTFTQHQNLDTSDSAFDRDRFGVDPLVHFSRIGVLTENCTFMHMNVLTSEEQAAVVDAGMSLAWHPGNYLFYGISRSGPSPAPGLHARGVNIGLGTDLAKAWALGELGGLGYLVARMNGEFVTVDEVLAMHTIGGAKAVGMAATIGSLEPGKRADLVLRSVELPDAWPGFDPVRNAVLISRTKSVKTVIVDGRIIVEDGRLTTVDEAEVFREARASAERIRSAVGLTEAAPG